MKEKNSVRNSNHELMRLVSMFLIVMTHVINCGYVLQNSQNAFLSQMVLIIYFVTMVHVNSFVLLTGYYQCKKNFKQSTLWKLMDSTLFYKITITLILCLLGYISVSKVEWIQHLFPINMTMYWFLKVYFILYCISPFLNKLIQSLSKNDFKKLLIVGFVVMSIIPTITDGGAFANNGHTLYNFVYLYFVGAYLRMYPLDREYIYIYI